MFAKHTVNRIGSGGAGFKPGRLEHTAGERGQSLGAEEAKKHTLSRVCLTPVRPSSNLPFRSTRL